MSRRAVHLVRPLPVAAIGEGVLASVVVCRTLGARAILGRTTARPGQVTCRSCRAVEGEPDVAVRLAALAADLRHAVEVARVYGVWSDDEPRTLYQDTPARLAHPFVDLVDVDCSSRVGVRSVHNLELERQRLVNLTIGQRAAGHNAHRVASSRSAVA
ncbi:hypothetical protein [Cellulosimicrobium sp. I38E]|uniref:hypothetical protein n=1 Tax=Cellulosimicrobium sp. I38E TaxID=1393139 RepID=UPI0007B20986|nr:hypothetical protein [Cellulosimicrobium sp. I38E]KZM78372.1 hypothetical protein A0J59_13650 [Cellulosimicrobium sp. I38E]